MFHAKIEQIIYFFIQARNLAINVRLSLIEHFYKYINTCILSQFLYFD